MLERRKDIFFPDIHLGFPLELVYELYGQLFAFPDDPSAEMRHYPIPRDTSVLGRRK